jgi:hypothetical protein
VAGKFLHARKGKDDSRRPSRRTRLRDRRGFISFL